VRNLFLVGVAQSPSMKLQFCGRVEMLILLALLLGCIAVRRMFMRPIVTDQVACLLVSRWVCHTSEPCRSGWTDWDAVWVEDSDGPRELCIRWGSRSSHWNEGAILRGKGRPIVKYTDTLRSSVQKRLNRSRCSLGYMLGWCQGIVCYMGSRGAEDVAMAANFEMQIVIIGLCER